MITPTAGKKIRIITLGLMSDTTTQSVIEVYFGTGANLAADTTKVVANPGLDQVDLMSMVYTWPDGAGPVGAVDAVLSIRTVTEVGANVLASVQYREE